VFSSNKLVTAGHVGVANHFAVVYLFVCRYAAMVMSAGCGDANGIPFANNQPGTLMLRNSGCHLRKKKPNDK
jgi:hypothetical protein